MDIIEARCTLHGILMQYTTLGATWPENGFETETCPIQSNLSQERCGLPLMHVLAQDQRPPSKPADNPLIDLDIGTW